MTAPVKRGSTVKGIYDYNIPIEKRIAALEAITSPVELTDQDFKFRGLLYGDVGSGKTTLAAQIAAVLGNKILLGYNDSAWTVVLNYPDIYKKTIKIPFEGLSTVHTVLDARAAGIAPYSEFDVLIWDTASTGVDNGLRTLVERRKFEKDQYADDLEGRPHYRLIQLAMRELVLRLNRSDLHVIYTAHLRNPSEDDIKKGKLVSRPAFPDATYNAVARESNMVGYMYKEKSGGDRLIQLSGTERQAAKCQIPGIPEKTYPAAQIPTLLKEWLNKK